MVYPAPIKAEIKTATAAEIYVISNGLAAVPVSEIIMTPVNESGIPTTIFFVIFSLRRTAPKITVKIGMVAIIRLATEADMYNSP